MTALHGRNTKVWFNSADLSGFLHDAGLDVSAGTSDVTTFASGGWRDHISGLLEATMAFAGNYDVDEGRSMGDSLGVDAGVLTYCPGAGAAIGDLARLASITGTAYRESSPYGDKVAVSWDALSEEALHFGYVLHPFGEDTNTTTGASRNDGAATETGWTAHLHCSLVDGGSWVVKIQDSADNSNWDDVTGGAFDALTAAGYQRLQSAAADDELRRYIRYVATRTGGSAGQGMTFGLAIARTR